MSAPENPSAFPEVPGDMNAYAGRAGMTLRDWFAGQVVAQTISLAVNQHGSWEPENAAYHAYLVADAMLAARLPDAGEPEGATKTDAPAAQWPADHTDKPDCTCDECIPF